MNIKVAANTVSEKPSDTTISFHLQPVQGGQSRGQHKWVHGFPEPVKSFITFGVLSQISCGKVQKKLIFFLHKTVSKFLMCLL